MQKQILKGVTMLMLIAAVALMAALVSAHAQSSSIVVADIPFDFAVGGKSLKAGEYSVRPFTTSGDTVVIRNQDSNDAALRLTHTVQAGVAPDIRFTSTSSPRRSSSPLSASRNWFPPPYGGGANSWKSAMSARLRRNRMRSASVTATPPAARPARRRRKRTACPRSRSVTNLG